MIDHHFEMGNFADNNHIVGIYLEKIWTRIHNSINGQADQNEEVDFLLERAIFDLLGISQADALRALYECAHSYQAFLERINDLGPSSELSLTRLSRYLSGQEQPQEMQQIIAQVQNMDNVLSDDDILQWQTHGFVVVKNAIDQEMCNGVICALGEYLQMDMADTSQWYVNDRRSGIMVELIQHEALNKVRSSKRIYKAFSQLWQTTDLVVSADRCGFNPPQTDREPFPGPDLHWDVDFSRPLTFGTQGIIYLTDTEEEQGALTLVPGFHKKLTNEAAKYQSQPNPAKLHELGSKPIAANAGDMIIWHHFLPHGSRANLTDKPRIVQYLNMYPFPYESVARWR